MFAWLSKLRDNFAEYGRSSCWRATRQAHLSKHPTCEACGSREGLDVHHIQPVSLYPELECEESNLMTLCGAPRNCHYSVGHGFNWRGYRPDAKKLAQFMASCVVVTERR